MSGDAGARQRRPLVIGFGNTLRRDDAVGVRVAELAQEDPRFAAADVLAVHQLTPELALDIGAASLVVFVDADAAAEPGAVEARSLTSASATATAPGASSHHVGAAELLALATALVGTSPPAWAVAIGVADLELGEGLSSLVEAALTTALDAVAGLVAPPATT